MNLCLNMIVRNESARIERALASVAPHITSWVIVDTGSTDDTKEKIVRFFEALKIPGEIRDEPFVDFSQARNAALEWGRRLAFAYQPDHFLLMDADMELVVVDQPAFAAARSGTFDMWQRGGAVHYLNRRFVSALSIGGYVGVTHEYLDIGADGQIEPEVAYFTDHADGTNRLDKFKRDIRLLKAGLKKEPNNARYFFYLACSYRDAKQPERAALWFQRRIAAGGWEEEVWQARVNLAHCYKDMGKEPEFVSKLLEAYSSRPHRAEPMFDMAKHYREKPASQGAALAAAEAVEHLPKPTQDSLFVNDYVYQVGIQEEIAICSYYVPGKMMKGLRACSALSQHPSHYWDAINNARNSMYHYLFPLTEFCPSFEWKTINYTPPEGWVALNPSVCIHHEALHCNVRLVNYRIDDAGRYLIRNTETGEITRDNPIHTRNVVLYMGYDPFTQTHPWEFECYRHGNMPVLFPLVVGYEDMRIFEKMGRLTGVSCVRQLAEDGIPEQVWSRLEPVKSLGTAAMQHIADVRMLREKRECEKNWAPILAPGQQTFMWRPGTVINTDGKFVSNNPPPFRVDNISGSSQVIPWANGYLALVHTAHVEPAGVKRYYTHRFITYDQDFKVKRMSLPFYFNDKGIEFCAGLCAHPTKNELVISYGHQDNDARIATVKCDEVETFLCTS